MVLLLKTRDADRFYLALNDMALNGVDIESVAPADDDVLSVYEYLIGNEEVSPMKRLWWAQIKAVIRLEMRKTFFARRGLWIYVLAALPVLLFVAYAIANSTSRHRRATVVARRGEKPLTYQDLLAVHAGT